VVRVWKKLMQKAISIAGKYSTSRKNNPAKDYMKN
jgi:hypothetical protein